MSVRPSVRPSAQTLWEGEGSPKTTRRGQRMPSFLGGKPRGAFGQPAFFLAGNHMTIVAFEKEVSLKASASLAFNDCSRVLKFYT